MGKRCNVFAITEKGITRYFRTKQYGGISGVTLRFIKNEKEHEKTCLYYERLKNATEITECVYLEYLCHPEAADILFSLIEVDVDRDIIRIDEDMREKRIYREYPLKLLLEEGKHYIRVSPRSGYDTVDKDKLYCHMDTILGKEPWKSRYGFNFNKFAAIHVTENGCDEYFITHLYHHFTLASSRYREYCKFSNGIPVSGLFADREALSERGYSFLCDNFTKNPYLRNLIEFNVDEQVVRLLKKGEDGWKEY